MRTFSTPGGYATHMGLVGWNTRGPLAVTSVPLATSGGYGGGGGLGQAISTIARGGSDGSSGIVLGGSGCTDVVESASGTVACLSGGVEGHSATGGNGSPDPSADRSIVQAKDGSTIDLPVGFRPEGRLDASTLIGIHGACAAINGRQGPLAVVRLSSPTSLGELGFTGSYVGLIQAGISSATPAG